MKNTFTQHKTSEGNPKESGYYLTNIGYVRFNNKNGGTWGDTHGRPVEFFLLPSNVETEVKTKVSAEEIFREKLALKIELGNTKYSDLKLAVLDAMEEYASQFSQPESKVKDGFEDILDTTINIAKVIQKNNGTNEVVQKMINILLQLKESYLSFLPVETETKSVTKEDIEKAIELGFRMANKLGYINVTEQDKFVRSLLQTERRDNNE